MAKKNHGMEDIHDLWFQNLWEIWWNDVGGIRELEGCLMNADFPISLGHHTKQVYDFLQELEDREPNSKPNSHSANDWLKFWD